jgi:hypothetical protein
MLISFVRWAVGGTMKNFYRIVFAICLMFAGTALGQDVQSPRTWTSSDGKKIVASLEDFNATHVKLRVANKSEPSSLPISRLGQVDQNLIRLAWFDRRDQQQYVAVRDQLHSLHDRPKTVELLLKELHKEYPESPYAGLWAAVAMIGGSNDHEKAASFLKQTLDRIKKQQEIDPSRHRTTFVSANNNLAVCMVKARKGDAAANYIQAAIEARSTVHPTIRANAEFLNEITSGDSALITFNDIARSKLMRALALADTNGVQTKHNNGWHYSLDFDLPSEGLRDNLADGIDSPRSDLRLLAQGSGIVVAPGIVLTSREVVETSNYQGPELVTVIVNPGESVPRTEMAAKVILQSRRTVSQSQFAGTIERQDDLGGQSRTNAVFTSYSIQGYAEGSSQAELAALRIPELLIEPLPIAVKNPQEGEPLSIWGYRRGSQGIREGLTTEVGKVLRGSVIRGGMGFETPRSSTSEVMLTTARVLGGNRGGAVTDQNGVVVGIAYDTPVDEGEAQGWFFGAAELRRWFYKNVQTTSLEDAVPATGTNSQEQERALRQSIVPVLCWGYEAPDNTLLNQMSTSTGVLDQLFVRDGWCIACNGVGIQKCVNKNCRKGVIVGREDTQVATDLRGKPIYGKSVTRDTCPTCNGSGGKRCPHCNGGRLR